MPQASDAIGADGADGARRPAKLAPLRRLLPYLARQKVRIAGALFFLTLAAVTTLSLPLAVRRVVDRGFLDGDAGMIDAYFTTLLALAGVLALASAGRYYFVVTLGERLVADVRRDVFAHVMHLSPAFFDRTRSGEIVSRLTADTTLVKSVVGVSASVALRNLILCIGAVAMMVWTSPGLSAIVVGAIPVIVLPLVAFGRSVRRKARLAQDTLAEASAYAGEAIGGVRTVQAFTSEPAAVSRYGAAVDTAFGAARASTRARALLTAVAIFLVFTSVVAVLWVGAQRVAGGTMSVGTLGQFMLYAVFAAGALGAMSEIWSEVQQAAGATERLTELLAERQDVAPPAAPVALPVPARGEIVFDAVSFSYPTLGGPPAVRNVSFSVAAGERVAIVGPSGAGKSTLFGLIERFYDPNGGRILLDGVDLRAADLEEARGRIALVPQDVTVFAASVADNIAFGRPGGGGRRRGRGRDGGFRRRLHPPPTLRLRDRDRRARRAPVRRPAPAPRHRARGAARRADPPARRGDLRARR